MVHCEMKRHHLSRSPSKEGSRGKERHRPIVSHLVVCHGVRGFVVYIQPMQSSVHHCDVILRILVYKEERGVRIKFLNNPLYDAKGTVTGAGVEAGGGGVGGREREVIISD
jgi:hypothetical protein